MPESADSRRSSIDAVVFDLGNVLVEWRRDRLYQHVIPDPERRAFFFEHVATMDWNLALDRGLGFDEGVAELAGSHPEWRVEIEAYRDRWVEMLGPADDAAVQLMRELKLGGYGVFGLTNWSAETFPLAEERFEFLAELDGIVVSGREGVVKPEREIYDLLCERFGLTPERLVFTDDSPPNVAAAAEFGWNTHLWTGAVQFRAELARRGLLQREPG